MGAGSQSTLGVLAGCMVLWSLRLSTLVTALAQVVVLLNNTRITEYSFASGVFKTT